MCMPKAPEPPKTPEPAAAPAPPPSSIAPQLQSGARKKSSTVAKAKNRFRNDYKKPTSNTPRKTTASGLQINT